jgi:MraZ protein
MDYFQSDRRWLMFLGTHSPRLDEKGRLILPAKFREELADGLVLTRGQERCIYVFSQKEFERVHEQMREAPLSSRQARDYIRVFLSGASDEVPDKQGRITIPPALRSYAGLGRELAVIGAGTRAEIWDAGAWQTYLEAQETAFSETDEDTIPGIF